MRTLLGILVFLLAVNCKEKPEKPKKNLLNKPEENLSKYDLVEEDMSKDTIKNYWQVDYDTIKTSNELQIKNGEYKLKILNFSLNDSSIVRNTGSDSYHANFEIYHNRVSEIILSKEKEIVMVKRINKNDLKIGDKEFDQYGIIKTTKFMYEKNGVLYFSSSLNLPDTDWVEKVGFSILIEADNKGKMVDVIVN